MTSTATTRCKHYVWRRFAVGLWLLVLLTSLAACGGGGTPPATATAAPTQPPTQTPLPPAELGQIVWATSVDETTKAPKDQVTSYPHDAGAIYAVAPVTRIIGGTPVTAEWDYDGVAMPELTTTINAPELLNGGWLEFHITRATNLFWPVGTYHIRISVNGQPLQESSVAVQSN